MVERKYIKKLLESSKKFDIEKYKETDFSATHTAFEGTPKKHPADKNKVILLTNPFSTEKIFFEFSMETVAHIEEIGTITSEDGESVYEVRIWIKKGSVALKYEPFIVT